MYFLESQMLQRCRQKNLHTFVVMLNIPRFLLTVFTGAPLFIKGLNEKETKNCPRRRPLIGFLFACRDSKDSDICFPTSGSARDGLQSIITDLHIHPHLHNGRSKKRLSSILLSLLLYVCASQRTLWVTAVVWPTSHRAYDSAQFLCNAERWTC